jgi:transposase
MKSNLIQDKIFVGVDVSKRTLDVYRPDSNVAIQIENSDVAIAELCSQLERKKRKVVVVMEGTGGYEQLLLTHLASHKLDAAVINPRRIRDFAKGIGHDAKTDAIDAKVISKYAEIVKPQPMATKSDQELKHGALVARRNQLLELINQENNRLKQAWDKDAKQSIRDVLEMLKKAAKRR